MCGNGASGMSTPSPRHNGSHPSPGRHSIRRSAGISARTAALCASNAALATLSSRQSGVKRWNMASTITDQAGSGGTLSVSITSKMVRDALRHQLSASRVDNSTGASG